MFQTMIPAVVTTGIDRTHRSIEHNAGSNIFDAARFSGSQQPVSLGERGTKAPRELQRLNLEYDRHRHLYSWIEDSSAIGFNRQRDQMQQNQVLQQKQHSKHQQLKRHLSHDVVSSGEQLHTTQVIVDVENAPAKDDSSKRASALSIIKKLSPFDGGSRSDHSNSLESNPDQKKSMTASSGGSSKFRTASSGSKTSQHGGAVTSEDPLGELRWDKPLPLSVFVERYSLPKLVRINDNPVAEMLCRHLPNHADVTARIARARSGRNAGRILRIPKSYQGWFSLVSDKGDAVAAVHTTLMQLVRERVYKFVSTEPFAAYSETLAGRAQYIRGMARAGQVYRLLAVFQDGAGDSSNGNNKDGKGQYAQLLGDNQQIIYVSLSTKGKFYETSSSLPAPGKQSNFDKDCVHRLPNILQHCDLPVNVKLISGPLPDCMSQDCSDILTLQSVSSEPMLVTCSLTENPEGSELQYQLTKTTASPDVTVSRCIVGPDTEHRLYKSASAQNVLAFCQNNLDSWFRRIEVVDAPPVPENDKYENILNKIDGLKLLKSASFAKFLRGDNKHSPSHEKEDSIIFLSKHDLESMESDNMKKKHSSDYSLDKMSSEISSKMKVFEPSKRTKWFKHFRILNTSEQKDYRQEITEKYREFVDPFDPNDKSKSIERYQDMAKLIEERFGKKFSTQDKTPPVKNDSLKKVLTKSISVQTSCPDNSLDCAENDENKSIQPDVIPLEDLNKIEKYDEISDRTNSGPKTSFFTEKLCAEFHVKTKQLSKSTSSLNTILHFSVPQKMSVIELRKESQSNESITKATVHFPEHKTNEEEISNIQNRKLPEIDDLPYSTVRDRLDNKNQNQKIFEEEICPEDNENIYAEICGDTINFENGLFVNNNEIDAIILDTSIDADPINLNSGTTSSSSSAGKKIVSESSIKIKVGCDEGFVDTENITVIESDNCYMNVVESIEDTEAFYNTLK